MIKTQMNSIKNLNDLRYRKLLLRTEIMLKEGEIKRQVLDMKTELESSDFRGAISQALLSNPMLVINTARIAYNLVKSWKQRRKNKQLRRKNKD